MNNDGNVKKNNVKPTRKFHTKFVKISYNKMDLPMTFVINVTFCIAAKLVS